MAPVFKSLFVLDCILLLAVLLVGNAGADPRKKTCPRNVKKVAQRCMHHMQKPGFRDEFIRDGLKQLCRGGKIQRTFTCLNRLYTRCAAKKEAMEKLDMLGNMGQWRRSIDSVCHQGLDDQCEERARLEFQPCSARAFGAYRHSLKVVAADLQSLPDEQARLEAHTVKVDITCKFSEDITNCVSVAYEKHCTPETTIFVNNIMKEYIPQACAKRARQRSVHPYPKYEVATRQTPPPPPARHDSNYNQRNPDIVDIVQKPEVGQNEASRNQQVTESRTDANGWENPKASYEDEYLKVKATKEARYGAAKSPMEDGGDDEMGGNNTGSPSSLTGGLGLFSLALLVVLQKLISL